MEENLLQSRQCAHKQGTSPESSWLAVSGRSVDYLRDSGDTKKKRKKG